MAQRLTLSTVGIKSPLDVGQDAAARHAPPAKRSPEAMRVDASQTSDAPPAPETRRRSSSRRPRGERAASPRTATTDRDGGGETPFYGSGRPLQTSIAIDAELDELLEQVARAARVPVNALVVAALQAGLPPHSDQAREAIVDERVSRAGQSPARVERNIRLPEHLRARIDELVASARERLPRVARADLANASLRRGLPADAAQAAELVAGHARRLERAVAA